MKRLISVILTIALISSIVFSNAIFASAATTATLTGEISGDTATFTLTVSDAAGVGAYDGQFTITGGTTTGMTGDYDMGGINTDNNMVSVVLNNAKGTVTATITCDMTEDEVTLACSELTVYDDNGDEIDVCSVTCTVVRQIDATGVTIDENLALKTGETKTPSFSVVPSNATNKTVSFASDTPGVASVDASTGAVTGVSEGTAVITITTADGGFTDTCTVTVSCAHSDRTNTPAQDSSCTVKGWDAYSVCNDCGKMFDGSDNEITEIPYRDFASHTAGATVKENKTEPTCDTEGSYDNVVYCTVCNAEISRTHVTVDPNGHALTPTAAKAATCTEDGNSAYYTCSVCGKLFEDATGNVETTLEAVTIKATGHTPAAAVRENEIGATCDSIGEYDEVVYCETCNTELSREHVTGSVLGHNWDAGTITTPATCTTDGVKTYTCQRDSSHTKTEVIPATGHSPAAAVKENVVAATCESAGSYDEVVYCSTCNAEISRTAKTEAALGHAWDSGSVTTPATCTTDGVRTYTCQHDSSHTKTEVIPATGHSPAAAVKENVVAATCESAGSYDEVVYCSTCNAEISRTAKTEAALGHAWDSGSVTTPATCTTDGVKTYTCQHDSSHTKTEVIPATGHSPAAAVKENVVAATCETAGSYDEVVKCSRCDEEFSRTAKTIAIDANAHDWGDWVVTKEATESEKGSETRTCKLDDTHTETRDIPELPTDYEIIQGQNQELVITEGKDLVIVSNAPFDKFVEVRVDKVVVDPKNYTAEAGSTKVTVKAAYLATLSEGKHTFTIVSTNGEASTTFTLINKPESDAEEVANTADATNILGWVIMCAVSSAGITAIAVSKKRKERV